MKKKNIYIFNISDFVMICINEKKIESNSQLHFCMFFSGMRLDPIHHYFVIVSL